MGSAIMQLIANNQRRLTVKRMERIENLNLTSQIPGIMT
jgi:hypothetical protein